MTSLEQFRHECEVRAVLKMREESQGKKDGYLELVEKKRGAAVTKRLADDAKAQWARGNRGEWGIWK